MILHNIPSIRINGSSNLQIYNHKGLKTVSDKLIEICSSIGLVCIDGKSLQITEISNDFVSVNGKISKIYYKE